MTTPAMTEAAMTGEALPPILLVGGGRMGGAMLAGWVQAGLERAVVIDPAPGAAALAGAGVTVVAEAARVPDGFVPGWVVLAVKPQMADAVLPQLARWGAAGASFLSVMAGRSIAGLRASLGPVPVVRAMPNTPAAIGRGVTVACAGPGVDARGRAVCDRLLRVVGDLAWIEDEAGMDAVTAVSGSGPAYVFLLAELLEAAALRQGLAPDLARLLARRTVSGAGALLDADPAPAAALRRAVTSPGGTTEAALRVLMAGEAWPAQVEAAVAAAADRSRALGA